MATVAAQGVEVRATSRTWSGRQAGQRDPPPEEKFDFVLRADFFESEFNHHR